MALGRIDPPNLDDRTWQDLVNQAKALIPKYAPEWTDHNPSDLGITLIELFAWLVEQMIYRLNRVPEKNYIAFLNLLGITRDPATPATTYLTYRANQCVEVKKGSQAATRPAANVDPVIFETDESVEVLPLDLTTAWLIRQNEMCKYSYENVTTQLVGMPLRGKVAIEIAPTKTAMFVLGFAKNSAEAITDKNINLRFNFSQPITAPFILGDDPEYKLTTNGNELEVSDALRKAFAKQGSVLSAGDKVRKTDKPDEWIVTHSLADDKKVQYTVKKLNDRLSVQKDDITITWRRSQSEKPKRLFSIELNINDLIQDGSVPQAMCQEFSKVGIPLTPQARVSVGQAGSSWSINDGQKKYSIKKENNTFNVYAPQNDPFTWQEIVIANELDLTKGFTMRGIVKVPIPRVWDALDLQSCFDFPEVPAPTGTKTGALFWTGIEMKNNSETNTTTVMLEHILCNSIHATTALTLDPAPAQANEATDNVVEKLGVSDGTPFQLFQLKHFPLFREPGLSDPYSHLRIWSSEPIQGNGSREWKPWTRVDDLPKGEGDYYRLDPVTGTIYFGDCDAQRQPDIDQTSAAGQAAPRSKICHGSIPVSGTEIWASLYRYVAGGIRSNVPAGSVTEQRTKPDGIIAVINLLPATGGADEESVEEAKRRAPELLRVRSRAITAADFEYLAREASTRVKAVRCLGPKFNGNDDAPWTYGGLYRDEGHVNVIVVPAASTVDPLDDPTPMPSLALLEEVYDYLEQRRIVTTRLHVTPPRYLPVKVDVKVQIWNDAISRGLAPDPQEKKKLFAAQIEGSDLTKDILDAAAQNNQTAPAALSTLFANNKFSLNSPKLSKSESDKGWLIIDDNKRYFIQLNEDSKTLTAFGETDAWLAYIEHAFKEPIRRFLHPTTGGKANNGWEIGEHFTLSNLYDRIRPPSEIGFISSIKASAGEPLYDPGKRPDKITKETDEGGWVQVADYELVCSGEITVTGIKV